MTEDRRDIGSRLENWARWARADEPDQLPAGSPERRRIDEGDARLLDQCMPALRRFDRLLLWWCYVDQATPQEVCRQVGIAQRPALHFIAAFRVAQEAIEALAMHANSSAGTLTGGIMSVSPCAATS